MLKTCFLDHGRACTNVCAAFQEGDTGKGTNCRLLNFIDRLIPPPSRPTAPTPPVKVRP